jgi:hypothetical protein
MIKKLGLLMSVLILSLLTVGCVSNDAGEDITYKKRQLPIRVGYIDLKYDEQTFKVTYHGSSSMSMQVTQEFALLRAAEIAKQNNHKYFSMRLISQSTKIKKTNSNYGASTLYFPQAEFDIFLFHEKENGFNPIYSTENEIKRIKFKYELNNAK